MCQHHATSPQPRKACHLGSHACKPCHQSKGGKPWRIRGWHVDVTWIEGPTGTQTASKPSGHREPTWGRRTYRTAITRKDRPRWAHKGLTDPTGRPNRPCVGPSWPCTWLCLVGPGVHSRGVGGASTSWWRHINRREGTHFLPNSLSNSSLTFGFQGYDVG
jgi:hypothetical protein